MTEIALSDGWWWGKMRRAVQLYGPLRAKRSLWNREFVTGRWNCLTVTAGDPVYPILERYASGGSILDLGCGSGNTANELAPDSHSDYTGVDISDAAVAMAARRAKENGRAAKTSFFQSDIEDYVPTRKHDVILFRDSIYYVPSPKLKATLDRYTHYLEPEGVFVVRMYDAGKEVETALKVIESCFRVVEKHVFHGPWAMVIVFRDSSGSRA